MQNFDLIQPRTSPPKICKIFENAFSVLALKTRRRGPVLRPDADGAVRGPAAEGAEAAGPVLRDDAHRAVLHLAVLLSSENEPL